MKNSDALFVVTNHSELGGTPTGFCLEEAAYPYKVLVDAGFEVNFVSPHGGKASATTSNPEDPVNRWFRNDTTARVKIDQTLKPEEVDPADYAAIYYVGGPGALWDLKDHDRLQFITRRIWEVNGIVAGISEGAIGLLDVILSNGRNLIDGKRMTACSNAEKNVRATTYAVPFRVADELSNRGAQLQLADRWQHNVIIDGHFVTGQNSASAHKLGETMLNKLIEYYLQEPSSVTV